MPNKNNIENLFKNLCCSRCKNDFTNEDFEIVSQEKDILICNLVCQKCHKNFGQIILNICQKNKKHSPLIVIDGPPPINSDDVINAHRFIKENL